MNTKAQLLKTLIRQSIIKNIVNEEFKKGGNLEKWLNKQVADGKIKGLDLGNQIQVKLLNDVLAYIDSEVVEYAIERESDEAGLYREAADTNTVYYVKKNGAMYQTVMMIESGDNATVSDKLHDGIVKAGSKLWPSWGNYSLDDRACAAFLTAYFADRSWFSGTKPVVKSIQQLPRLMWPEIKSRAGKQIKENHKMNTKAQLLKTLIREEVRKQLNEMSDPDAVQELVLYAENDSKLYNVLHKTYVPALNKFIAKGNFDEMKALKLLEYYFTNYVRPAYKREFGDDIKLNPADRKAFAKEILDSLKSEGYISY